MIDPTISCLSALLQELERVKTISQLPPFTVAPVQISRFPVSKDFEVRANK